MAVVIKKTGGPGTKSVRHMFPVVKKADTALVIQDHLHWEDQFASLYWTSKFPNNPLILPPFNPETLIYLVTRNNILAQCVEAMEVNIDGTGHSIVKKAEAVDSMEEFKKQQEKNQVKAQYEADLATHQQATATESAKAMAAGQPPPPSKPAPQMPQQPPEEKDPEQIMLEGFFAEPWPMMSMVTLRRKIRFDLEATGNAYLEVVCNALGEVVFLRWLDCTTMRIVRLDAPTPVQVELDRNGEKDEANIMARERRYAQKVQEKLIYFREFGTSRELNRNTGVFESDETPVPPELRATQIIHFTLIRDVRTPYGLPRWINELPSVLGSRKAEEFNLEFFDSGGVPPAAVFVAGGAMADNVVEQLEVFFSGQAKQKHRVAVIQVESTSGTIDSPGKVDVKTERFGDSRGDSMFQTYDEKTEDHVRKGFRLPPIFLGQASDYNFATAMTAVMVTEAQVFQPQRLMFDEVINATICRSLGAKNYEYKSNPVTLKNVDVQLEALGLVQTKISGEEMVDTVNDITGLNLEYSQESDNAAQQQAAASGAAQTAAKMAAGKGGEVAPVESGVSPTTGQVEPVGGQATGVGSPMAGVGKAEKMNPTEIVDLVGKYVRAAGLEQETGDMPGYEALGILAIVEKLEGEEKALFGKVLSHRLYQKTDVDPDGLGVLAMQAGRLARKRDCGHAH